MFRAFILFITCISLVAAERLSAEERTYQLFIPDGDSFWYNFDEIETLKSVNIEPNRFYPQTQSNWCWAAVSATVIDILADEQVDPCRIASQSFRANCCNSPSYCNSTNSLDAISKIMAIYDLETEVIRGPVGWRVLKTELDNGYPVSITVNSGLGAGHIMNIVGYNIIKNHAIDKTRIYFFVHDPMHGYFKGLPSSMGYTVNYADLLNGRMEHYGMKWTNTVIYWHADDEEDED